MKINILLLEKRKTEEISKCIMLIKGCGIYDVKISLERGCEFTEVNIL